MSKNNRNILRIDLEELSSFETNIAHLKNEDKKHLPAMHSGKHFAKDMDFW